MNEFLSHVIRALTEDVHGIQAIALYGSQQNPQSVDMWSDYDIWIVLESSACIDEPRVIQAVHDMGFVVGGELHKTSHSVLYRTAIGFEASIRLLDLTVSHEEPQSANLLARPAILFGHLEPRFTPTIPSGQQAGFRPNEARISPTWFKYVVTINKFCRRDNLVGLHLLLDLVREYLVLEMVERDHRKQTNIHRYGDYEHLPEPIQLARIDASDTKQILDYIAKLAYAYDQKLASLVEGYSRRAHWVLEYLERSKAHLSGHPIADT